MTVAIADIWHWIDGNIYETSCFIERNSTFALDVTGYITTHFEIEQCFNLKTIIFFICCILPNDKRCRRYVLSYTINCIVYDYSYRMNRLLGLVLYLHFLYLGVVKFDINYTVTGCKIF
jgi:hypothetical protein